MIVHRVLGVCTLIAGYGKSFLINPFLIIFNQKYKNINISHMIISFLHQLQTLKATSKVHIFNGLKNQYDQYLKICEDCLVFDN